MFLSDECSLLRAEGFCILEILYGGLGIGKMLFKSIIFWSSKPCVRIGSGSGSVFSLKCLIRNRIKWIRIRNTGSELTCIFLKKFTVVDKKEIFKLNMKYWFDFLGWPCREGLPLCRYKVLLQVRGRRPHLQGVSEQVTLVSLHTVFYSAQLWRVRDRMDGMCIPWFQC